MKTNQSTSLSQRTILACLLALGPPLAAHAQNAPAIHWINDLGLNGATELNSTGAFTTSFLGTNDLTVTQLAGTVGGLVNNSFGGATPGNNPSYIKGFLGNPATGTGTGTAGTFGLLSGDPAATSSIQFDFSMPLTLSSRIMFGDVDTTERYQVQAFTLVEGVYQPLSLTGWTHDSFSGQSGLTPDATWAAWDGVNGTLTAPAGNPQINSPLDVLTPDQNVDRLVISKLAGTGGGWSVDIVNVVPEPSATMMMVGAGALAGLWWLRRQSKKVRVAHS